MSNYIVPLPLEVSQKNYKILGARFEAGRVYYNSSLAECKRRKSEYRTSENFIKARELYKEADKLKSSEIKKQADKLCEIARKEAGYYFRSASKNHNLNNSIEQYGYKVIRKSWLAKHLPARMCNMLSKRAFKASCKPKSYFMKQGKDFITSLETENSGSILWKTDSIVWDGVILKLNVTLNDVKYKDILDNPDKVLYVRLVRISVNDYWQYYAHVVCKGVPIKKDKHKLGIGKIGMDFGPSAIGYFNENLSEGIVKIAEKLNFKQKEIRRLQRKLDRQRHANNPNNYDEKGICRRGVDWVLSKKQMQTQSKLKEIKRKESCYRRCLHGQLANSVRSDGDKLFIENLNYKSWQMGLFGKSVGKRAPALLVNLLKNKFNNTGGEVYELDARKLRLSQTCPNCENIKKKNLSERLHNCEKCGMIGQRDIVSALLAICVNPDTNEINSNEARKYLRLMGKIPIPADEVN